MCGLLLQDESTWLKIGSLVQSRCGVSVLLHLTCHLPLTSLRRILSKAREAGIRNILALRGGPSMGMAGAFRPVPGGLKNAIDLVRTPPPFPRAHECVGALTAAPSAAPQVRVIREDHGDHFCVGVAGYPEVHNEAWNSPYLPPSEQSARLDLERLREKVSAGADFVLTQFVYDADVFLAFEKVRAPLSFDYFAE